MTEATTRRSRITRGMMIDAFKAHTQLSRVDLQDLFSANPTTMQMHITDMRSEKRLYIADWREPKATGMWGPVYALRTEANEEDMPHPPPRNRWRKVADVLDDDGKPVVMRAKGVKTEHAVLARIRSETLSLGMWGQLVAPWKR